VAADDAGRKHTVGKPDGRADVEVGSEAARLANVRLYLGKDFGGTSAPAATDLDPLGGAVRPKGSRSVDHIPPRMDRFDVWGGDGLLSAGPSPGRHE
jgi:hypothetical protein